MRAVFETLGIQDVVSKSVGSSSPYNMVRATFEGLKNIQSPRSIASRRGLKVSSIFGKKTNINAKNHEEEGKNKKPKEDKKEDNKKDNK
jgi:small subunit ribosomal protein S5